MNYLEKKIRFIDLDKLDNTSGYMYRNIKAPTVLYKIRTPVYYVYVKVHSVHGVYTLGFTTFCAPNYKD